MAKLFSETVSDPLLDFLSQDVQNLSKFRSDFLTAQEEHDEAMNKFSRTSKRKDSERGRFEANAEIFQKRQALHHQSLDYAMHLNLFKRRRR